MRGHFQLKRICWLVANLVRRKGILPLLEAYHRHLTTHEAGHLTIAGSHNLDPAYAKACVDLVHTSAELSRRVTFLKDQSPEELRQAYLEHDLLMSAAEMETYGMAIREAICFGLPVFCLGDSGYAHQHPEIFGSYESVEELVREAIQVGTSAEFPTLQRQKWAARPEPISWTDQAQQFIRQTQPWIANR